jgi:hypothetical protein
MSKQQPPARSNPKREQRIRETQQKREARLRAQRQRQRARFVIIIVAILLIGTVAFFAVAFFAHVHAAPAGMVTVAMMSGPYRLHLAADYSIFPIEPSRQ